MKPGLAGLLSIDDAPEPTASIQFACVADLPAHLGVKRRGVEDDGCFVFHADDFNNFRWSLQVVVSYKLRGSCVLDLGEFDNLFFLSGTSAGLLLIHQSVEARDIDRHATLASHQFREIQREAVRVVETKCEAARNDAFPPFVGCGG